MGCTVQELGRRLSSAELTEWLAFDLLEPIGGVRADDRARGIMAMVAASAGAKNAEPSQFLQTWRPQQEINEQAKFDALMAWADRHSAEGD